MTRLRSAASIIAWQSASLGAIGFSGKAIIVKLAYRYGGVDAVTLLMWRMLLAFPLFLALAWWAGRGKPKLTARDWRDIVVLGFTGYYLASFLDFAGLAYISASLERLILYLNPTLVLLISVVFLHHRLQGRPKLRVRSEGNYQRVGRRGMDLGHRELV